MITTPSSTPTHSVTTGKLFLSMQKITLFLEKHEKALEDESRENLLACVGSLVSQIDMMSYIEAIPEVERTPRQTVLLVDLGVKGLEMVCLVDETLNSFEKTPLSPRPSSTGATHE